MTNPFVLSQCLISMGIIAWIWFWLCGSLRRDNFRADIRRLRDGLFDYMLDQKYDFGTPAYRETRDFLNTILRLNRSLTPSKFTLALFLAMTEYGNRRGSADEFNGLEGGSLKDKLYAVRSKAVERVIHFVYLEGIFGLLFGRLVLRLVFNRIVVNTTDVLIPAAQILSYRANRGQGKDSGLVAVCK
jgi:hypothetical protein